MFSNRFEVLADFQKVFPSIGYYIYFTGQTSVIPGRAACIT